MEREALEKLATEVIDSLFEVPLEFGSGLFEYAYEMAPCQEFTLRETRFERQKLQPVIYNGITLDCGFPFDVLVEDEVVLELKSVDALLPIHDAQLISYLPLADKRIGFLNNFTVPRIKDGIRRHVNKLEHDEQRPRDFAL